MPDRPSLSRSRPALPAGATVLALLAVAGANTAAAAATEVDLTDFPGAISVQYPNTDNPVEGAESAVDNRTDTKYFTVHGVASLTFTLQTAAVVNRFSITSANDAPERDPKAWVLEGSNNGSTWKSLDSRSGVVFNQRFLERSFSLGNSTAYKIYRLRVTATDSGWLQLAEWKLFGPSSTTPPAATPTAFAGQVISSDQTLLTWQNVTRSGTVRLERSTDGTNWTRIPTTNGTWNALHDDSAVQGSTAYRYRLRSETAAGASGWTPTITLTTPSAALPDTIHDTVVIENDVHDGTVYRRAVPSDLSADLAVYTDAQLGDGAAWVYRYWAQVWRYTKQTYGDFGNPRLFAVLHQGRFGLATPYDRRSPQFGYRTSLDLPSSYQQPDQFADADGFIHELGHNVENYNGGVDGTPHGALWDDSMWCDIFQYDVYVATGRSADAERVKAIRDATVKDRPRASGTYWFRDWFYPIWRDHGHGAVLARYIKLVAEQFPAYNAQHTRDMNLGELVHFFSGAAGVNLQPLAANAFGWTAQTQAEFTKARADFPQVTYTG